MLRNMVTSLIEYERIETTLAKAKQLRRIADRMVTLGKEGTLHARRRALRILRKKSAISKLFTTLAERFRDRAGGYTRIIKLGFRHGDGAPMAIIEFLGFTPKVKVKEQEGKKKKAGSTEKKEAKAKASSEEKPKKEKKAKEKPKAEKKEEKKKKKS